jgi:hypothetical protein
MSRGANKQNEVKKMNALEQKMSNLLWWAKYTCEEEEARSYRAEIEPPTWLAELRSACDAAEMEGAEAIEP